MKVRGARVLVKDASCYECFEKRRIQPGHFLCSAWWVRHPRWAAMLERGDLDLVFQDNCWLLIRWVK